MGLKFLIAIDLQKDFIDGTLGTPEAQTIIPSVIDKITKASDIGYKVIFTRDTHYEDYASTQEGKRLPVSHCMYHSDGWQIPPEISYASSSAVFYCKSTFGCSDLVDEIRGYEECVDEIVIIGLVTDICVISNALLLKPYFPDVPIIVDASCCAGTTQENHNKALDVMQQCQIIITNRS